MIGAVCSEEGEGVNCGSGGRPMAVASPHELCLMFGTVQISNRSNEIPKISS